MGRTADKGRLLTTLECVTGIRKWRNSLIYYVMATDVVNDENSEDATRTQCIWSTAKYDKENSDKDTVHLVTMSIDKNGKNKKISDDEVELEAVNANVFQVPKNLSAFSTRFAMTRRPRDMDEVYSPSNDDPRECSIVVMGPGEIGKSALINKFVKGTFPHDYDPTIQDHARKQILVDDEPALLDILDTAGQEEFGSMRYDWLKNNIDVLLICFSRADHDSFIRAEQLIDVAKRLLRQKVCFDDMIHTKHSY